MIEGAGSEYDAACGDPMRILQHKNSNVVELADRSAWRIWPGDAAKTLEWLPTTDLDVIAIKHEVCSHALVDRAHGSRVRVIDARARWPVETVRQLLGVVDRFHAST